MKKEFKRFVKSALTFALALTMIFGQFPSGLVLNAMAAPAEETSEALEPTDEELQLSAGVETVLEGGEQETEAVVTTQESIGEEAVSEPVPSTDETMEPEISEISGEGGPVSSLLSAVQGVSELLLTVTEVQYLAPGDVNDPNPTDSSNPDPSDPVNPDLADQEPIEVKILYDGGVLEKESSDDKTIPIQNNFKLVYEDVDGKNKDVEGATVSLKNTPNGEFKGEFEDFTPGESKKILTNLTFGDFQIGNVPDGFTVPNDDTPVDLGLTGTITFKNGYSSVDLRWNNELWLDSDKVVFSADSGSIDNATWYKDETITVTSENKRIVIMQSDEKNQYSLSPFSLTVSDGKENTFDRVVIVVNNTYYAPLSITYNADSSAPSFDFSNAYKSGVIDSTNFKKIVFEKVKNNSKDNENGSGIDDSDGVYVVETNTELDADGLNEIISVSDPSNDNRFKNDEEITVASEKYYYVFLRDKLGNTSVSLLDNAILQDADAPTINLTVTDNSGNSFAGLANYYESLQFVATAEDNEDNIRSIQVTLYDGAGTQLKKYQAFDAVSVDQRGETTLTSTVSVDNSSYVGYQLSILVQAEDFAGNIAYSVGKWNGTEIALEPLTVGKGKTVEDAIKTVIVNNSVTFALVGYNQSVEVEFGDTQNGETGSESGVYYYNMNNKYLKQRDYKGVSFNNIGVDKITFNRTGETVTFDAESYDASIHSYVYKDKNSQDKWVFSVNSGSISEIYTISLENAPSFITDNTDVKNKKFVLVDTTVKISLSYSADEGIANSVGKDGIWYFGASSISNDTEEKHIKVSIEISTEQAKNKIWDANVTVDGNQVDVNWEETNEFNKGSFELAEYGEGKHTILVSAIQNGGHGNKTQIFNVDKTVPVLTSVKYSAETNYTDGNYWYGLQGGDDAPTDIVVDIAITEANFIKEDCKVSVKKDGVIEEIGWNGSNSLGATLSASQSGISNTVTVTIPGRDNDGKYYIIAEYKDPVGNKMVLTEGTTGITVASGKYSGTEHPNMIDTIRPEATFSITEISDDNGRTKYDDADYYKVNFNASFTVTDDNYDNRYTKAVVKAESNSENPYVMSYTSKEFSFITTLESGQEDTYTFAMEGAEESPFDYVADLAGNKMIIVKGDGTTDKDPAQSDGKYESGKKVLDMISPVATFAFVTEADVPGLQNLQNDKRFFFNKSFTAKLVVEETHFSDEIKATYGSDSEAENYETDTVDVNENNTIGFSNESDNMYVGSLNSDNDGLYIFQIEGEDKAGNEVVGYGDNYINVVDAFDVRSSHPYGNCYAVDTNGKKVTNGTNGVQTSYGKEGSLVSYIIAVDTAAPELSVKMRKQNDAGDYDEEEANVFYLATLNKNSYSVNKNMPYQHKSNARIDFTKTDKSATNLKYDIQSTIGASETETGLNQIDFYIDRVGSQVFWINELSIVDRAGNEVAISQKTNNIYLDVDAPSNDELAPSASIATATGAGIGPNGNPLYKDDVIVDVSINDIFNDPEITLDDQTIRKSSSGLFKIYYEVIVTGRNETHDQSKAVTVESTNGEVNTEGDVCFISYNTSGSDINIDPENETLTYDDSIKITIPANATFNFNDIVLRVWTEDNAGNIIEKENAASYAFGIDTQAPSISVSYDNNDAQNGKYFKANRTAYVTVKERNFSSARTTISTQTAAHISGWSYTAGSSDNGDDDKWTATVLFDTDGDYTMGGSTTDLVGHSANGVDWGASVAPTEFTIDKTKPVIAVSFDNNNVLNGRYYNANRRSTIDILEHNFDAKDATIARTAYIAEGSVVLSNIGAWSRTGDTNRTEVYFGADGDYTMVVDYVDLAGNAADTYTVDPFTIDTVAPELEISGVEDKHAYNGNVAPSITYHDINCDKTSAEVKITGYKHTSGENLTGVRNDTQYGGSFVCDNIEVKKDNDDIYTAVGSVRDLAGNETSKEVKFSVNRFGSTYELDDVSKELVDMVYTNAERTIGVREINVNELVENGVTYSLNGNVVKLEQGSEYTVKSDNPGWWEYNYSIDATNFAKEGRYNITLSSEDAAGNKNTNNTIHQNSGNSSLPIEFVIDKTAPSLIITGVEENGRYRDEERVIVVRYEDNSFVGKLELYVNDQLVKQLDSKSLAEAGGEIEYTVKSRSSWQNVRVEAIDAASNAKTAEISRFLLTRNALIQFVNNIPLLIGSIAGFIAIITGIFVIILLRRRRRNRY